MSYQNYLKTFHWMSTKTKIYRKHKKCYFCGSKKKLNIHHCSYIDKNGKSILFKETGNNLIVLCNKCHTEWHKINGKKIYSRNIYNLISNLYKKYRNINDCCNELKKQRKMLETNIIKKEIIEPKKDIKVSYTLRKINGVWECLDLNNHIL